MLPLQTDELTTSIQGVGNHFIPLGGDLISEQIEEMVELMTTGTKQENIFQDTARMI